MRIPDIKILQCMIKYDESSPSYLRWVKSTVNGKGICGEVCGYKRKNGYWFTGIDKNKYQNGLLVLLLNGYYPPENHVVDHIDGNPSNNKIDNLRFVSHAVNSRNRKLPSNNSVGVTGVYVQGGVICTSWYDLSKTRNRKYFSIKRYGYELALQLAIEFRKQMLENLNDNGAGYTDRHVDNMEAITYNVTNWKQEQEKQNEQH